MKFWLPVLLLLLTICSANAQQKIIQLYDGNAPGSENWTWHEGVSEHNAAKTRKVYNVVHPTLNVFLPNSSISNGTAVIICPGGSFQTLSIDNEGYEEARWLIARGVTVFVLKYRVIHSLTNDPVKELNDKFNSDGYKQEARQMIPLSIADAKQAVSYVRAHAAEYNLSATRIGIMGFSAGGTLAGALAFKYTPSDKPDFVALLYPFLPAELEPEIPADAPPMFIAAASDDELGLAPNSVDIYQKWLASKHPVELHMYTRGGHGFGMRKQNLLTDNWITLFADWLELEGFLKPMKAIEVNNSNKKKALFAMKKTFWLFVVSAGIEPATQGFSVFILAKKFSNKNRVCSVSEHNIRILFEVTKCLVPHLFRFYSRIIFMIVSIIRKVIF